MHRQNNTQHTWCPTRCQALYPLIPATKAVPTCSALKRCSSTALGWSLLLLIFGPFCFKYVSIYIYIYISRYVKYVFFDPDPPERKLATKKATKKAVPVEGLVTATQEEAVGQRCFSFILGPAKLVNSIWFIHTFGTLQGGHFQWKSRSRASCQPQPLAGEGAACNILQNST